MEHAPWIGESYKRGLDGQRVAIVGYSHWREEESDTADFTQNCVSRVISGEWKIRFFSAIRNYFGYQDHSTFWSRVMFFNYLPSALPKNLRFSKGSSSQILHAQKRFHHIIEDQRPDKVLVFTRRYWAFPGSDDRHPMVRPFQHFFQEKHCSDGYHSTIYFLRHPQGACGVLMKSVISYLQNH